LFRKFSKGKELTRLAVTRFATTFLTLQCITQQKNALRAMFVLEEWTTSTYVSKNERKQVIIIIVCDDRFWKSI